MEQDPLSRDERRLFDELEDVIAEELEAQISVGRLNREDGARVTAGLIVDVVSSAFELRSRN